MSSPAPWVAAGLLLAACTSEPVSRPTAETQLIVLSITEFTGGPIKGEAVCEDKQGRALLDAPCLPEASVLANAVLNCGPTQVTIDVQPHASHVFFPAQPSAASSSPRAGSDVDVVRCVRKRVGFAFRAGRSALPPAVAVVEPDERAFRSLHAQP
jgi:hypothetical protein